MFSCFMSNKFSFNCKHKIYFCWLNFVLGGQKVLRMCPYNKVPRLYDIDT